MARPATGAGDDWRKYPNFLPDHSGYYLCFYATRQAVFWFDANRREFDTVRKIFYWRPLPKPPEGYDKSEVNQ